MSISTKPSHESNKKIANVAANPAVSNQTGWPIGFCWAESYGYIPGEPGATKDLCKLYLYARY